MAKNYSGTIKLFALNTSREFGEKVAGSLGIPLSRHEEREFEDGEHKIRSLENVRNCEVYIIQSLFNDPQQSVNDKLCRLLFFIGSLRDAGAKHVTALAPYLCYMRKDRKTKPRDPVTTRYIAGLFESVGTHRIVTVDVHNLQAYQNSFRCHTEHLEAQKIFTDYFATTLEGGELAVMSPDTGGVKRAEQFRQRLERQFNRSVPLIFLEKTRSEGVVSGETVVGSIQDKTVIIIDDLISSGTTLARAAEACKRMGAARVYAIATHGAFSAKASQVLQDEALRKVIITNSIPQTGLSENLKAGKITVLDIAPLFAETILRLHRGGSLISLLDPIDT